MKSLTPNLFSCSRTSLFVLAVAALVFFALNPAMAAAGAEGGESITQSIETLKKGHATDQPADAVAQRPVRGQ